MGQPLVEYEIDILEKLGDLSRQMDEVNGVEKGANSVQPDKEEALDQEIPLNIGEPADEVALDPLKHESEAASSHETVSLDEEGADAPPSEDSLEGAKSSESKAQSSSSQDQVGINIEDDELWDEGDVEEIPLFEEELLSEISQEEEKEKAAQEEKQEEKAREAKDENGRFAALSSEDEAAVSGEGKEEEQKAFEDETKETPDKEEIPPSSPEPASLASRIIPWAVTGLSTFLTILAIFTIWMLWKVPAESQDRQPKSASNPLVSESRFQGVPAHGERNQTSVRKIQYEAIDLAPFIIPGKSGGELVFFKLQVELVVPDAVTKQELMRRQAWLRDVIYQELKGLDISRGVKGDILERYRVPLLKRLNMEFSPLHIEDIRLMGYLLR